eukprot:1934686-Alexandrium_andersonii.AAC.1
MLRADQRVNEHLAERVRANVESQPAGSGASSSSGSGGGGVAPPPADAGLPRGPADAGVPEGPEGPEPQGDAGYPSEGMSAAGEAAVPEGVANDVDEEA